MGKAELLAAIGVDAAQRLIEKYSGTRIWVRLHPEPDDPLARVIGPAAAESLARAFGGQWIDVPRPRHELSARPRRELIQMLHRQGLTVNQIAREARCTRGWVFKVLASPHRPARPGCLRYLSPANGSAALLATLSDK